jgi:hypothetical protein
MVPGEFPTHRQPQERGAILPIRSAGKQPVRTVLAALLLILGSAVAATTVSFNQVGSPGYGLYYGRQPAGSMYHSLDHNPYDLNGSDLTYYTNDPVDTRGWTQNLLSAQPLSQ